MKIPDGINGTGMALTDSETIKIIEEEYAEVIDGEEKGRSEDAIMTENTEEEKEENSEE